MLAAREPGIASWLLSLLLHAALLAVLWWSAAPAVLHTPPPLAVELWAGGGSVAKQPPAVAVPKPPVTPAPAPVVPPAAAPQVQAPVLRSADVTLQGRKPQPKEAPQLPAPVAKPKLEKPKAESKPPAPVAKVVEPKPAAKPAPAEAKPAAKPAKAAKPAATDDLLDALDNLPPGPGKGKVTQAGSKQGVQGGSANGVADLRAQYIEAVRNRIRPYVMVPDGISGNPQAVVEVEILPTLEIRSSRLLHSSGVPAYDQAVLAALRDARRFPPLPKGADFAEFRRITLNFRPKE